MKTNEKKNTSAKKKLIPAVAMLTTSAVMLSTATYAWFTMNKDAEVTGLEMTATAGGSIEISLGQLGTDGLPTVAESASTVSSPTMDNKSWKSVIAVSDYYSKINKIKPASSINASDLYYVDDDSVYAGGRAVDDKTAITKTKAENEVPLAVRKTGDSAGLATVDNASNGYYLDIPVWIRTSQQKTQTVTCDVIITDNGDTVNGSELTKAVRVAVVPLSASKKSDVAMTSNSPAIAENASYTTDVSNISVLHLIRIITQLIRQLVLRKQKILEHMLIQFKQLAIVSPKQRVRYQPRQLQLQRLYLILMVLLKTAILYRALLLEYGLRVKASIVTMLLLHRIGIFSSTLLVRKRIN